MFTICTAIIQEGQLEKELQNMKEAEKKFTREIGVLERDFFQCIQQPHIIWSNTKWTGEYAHNNAAESVMKVRRDDRIASAYFQPGLYYEIFCKEVDEVAYNVAGRRKSELVVVCHGLLAAKKLEEWNKTLRELLGGLPSVKGLEFCRTFYNYYNQTEFVGFMGWHSEQDYQEHRMKGDFTIEELYYTGLKNGSSLLAAYNQFYCRPLKIS